MTVTEGGAVVVDSSNPPVEPGVYRRSRRVVWVNNELAVLMFEGEVIGAARRRLDGGWDAVLGSPHSSWKAAARSVLGAHLAAAS